MLDHLALDEASDVDDGDREWFAGRCLTQLSTGVGAGASQSRPDGVAGDADVLDGQVEVVGAGAQLGDDTCDTGGSGHPGGVLRRLELMLHEVG